MGIDLHIWLADACLPLSRMTRHYHCGYELSDGEVRMFYVLRYRQPWPQMVFRRIGYTSGKMFVEIVQIGLN